MITVPDSADEELLARMREIAQCMAAIREARGETAPYSRETLEAAAAEIGRQLHGGPADPDDIKLAGDVLNTAYAVRDGG